MFPDREVNRVIATAPIRLSPIFDEYRKDASAMYRLYLFAESILTTTVTSYSWAVDISNQVRIHGVRAAFDALTPDERAVGTLIYIKFLEYYGDGKSVRKFSTFSDHDIIMAPICALTLRRLLPVTSSTPSFFAGYNGVFATGSTVLTHTAFPCPSGISESLRGRLNYVHKAGTKSQIIRGNNLVNDATVFSATTTLLPIHDEYDISGSCERTIPRDVLQRLPNLFGSSWNLHSSFEEVSSGLELFQVVDEFRARKNFGSVFANMLDVAVSLGLEPREVLSIISSTQTVFETRTSIDNFQFANNVVMKFHKSLRPFIVNHGLGLLLHALFKILAAAETLVEEIRDGIAPPELCLKCEFLLGKATKDQQGYVEYRVLNAILPGFGDMLSETFFTAYDVCRIGNSPISILGGARMNSPDEQRYFLDAYNVLQFTRGSDFAYMPRYLPEDINGRADFSLLKLYLHSEVSDDVPFLSHYYGRYRDVYLSDLLSYSFSKGLVELEIKPEETSRFVTEIISSSLTSLDDPKNCCMITHPNSVASYPMSGDSLGYPTVSRTITFGIQGLFWITLSDDQATPNGFNTAILEFCQNLIDNPSYYLRNYLETAVSRVKLLLETGTSSSLVVDEPHKLFTCSFPKMLAYSMTSRVIEKLRGIPDEMRLDSVDDRGWLDSVRSFIDELITDPVGESSTVKWDLANLVGRLKYWLVDISGIAQHDYVWP
jgi:hypothetical protein